MHVLRDIVEEKDLKIRKVKKPKKDIFLI